jgi:hypothetical protein
MCTPCRTWFSHALLYACTLYIDSCSVRLKLASLQVVVRKTSRMGTGRNRESLKKFAQTIESLDLEKRVAATKWLEGVIVAQNLTAEEREGLVRASNEYIGAASEADYADEVNALMDYLRRVQRESNRALKKTRKKRLVENLATV